MDKPSDSDEALGRFAERVGDTTDPGRLAEKLGLDPSAAARAEEVVRELGGAAPSLPPPELPSDYELLGEIGRGGMGVVYRARQKSLDRTVAVKVIRPEDLVLREALARFRKEARSMAKLRHPNIVAVHEVGEAGGHLYLTMDYIDGEPLSRAIERGPLTPAQAVRILRPVAAAVAYSHAQGVVHRDLKPANIPVGEDGRAYVMDFGLALDVGESTMRLTQTGVLMGTPAYMSPEQAAGDAANVGERSDVYALGVILYECLTGRLPFNAPALAPLVHKILREEPPPPRRLVPSIPRDLDLIVMTAMAKEPEARYAGAKALLEDLERFEEGRPIRARAPSVAYRAARFVRRHRPSVLTAAATAVVLIAIGTGLIAALKEDSPEQLLNLGEDLHARGEHDAARVVLERAWAEVDVAEYDWPSDRVDFQIVPSNSMLLRSPYERDKRVQRVFRARLRCALEALRRLDPAKARPALDDLVRDAFDVTGRHPAPFPELWWAVARNHADDDETASRALATFEVMLRKGDVIWERTALLRFLDSLADDVKDPNAPAHAMAVHAVRNDVDPDTLEDWLRGRADDAEALLPGLLSIPAEGCRPNWTSGCFFCTLAAPLNEGAWSATLLDAIEREAAENGAARIFLCHAADLPVWQADDPELMALWREVRSMSRLESYRRRIEFAIRRVDAEPGLGRWLGRRTGFDGTDRRRWWDEHGADDPRDWLRTGADEREAMERYLDPAAADEMRRARLHHLMTLELPEDGPAGPLWRVGEEPRDLPFAWYRMTPPDEAPFVVQLGVLYKPYGVGRPRLVRSETREVRFGESLSLDFAVDAADRNFAMLGSPEFEEERVTVEWAPPWHEREILSRREGPGYVGVAASSERLIVVACVDPGAPSTEPWDEDAWAARIADGLSSCVKRLASEPRIHEPWIEVVRTWCPAEAAGDALRLVRELPPDPVVDEVRWIAGDDRVLEEPGSVAEWTDSRLVSTALATHSPRLRQELLARPRYSWEEQDDALLAAAMAGEVELPAGEVGRLWRRRVGGFGAAVLGIFAALVLAGLTFWARARHAQRLRRSATAYSFCVFAGLISIWMGYAVLIVALVALGLTCAQLAREGDARIGWVSPAAFAGASCAALAAFLWPRPVIGEATWILMLVGFVGLEGLLSNLDPGAREAWSRRPLPNMGLMLGVCLVLLFYWPEAETRANFFSAMLLMHGFTFSSRWRSVWRFRCGAPASSRH